MGIDRPEASSTPTAVPHVKGRKGLRDEGSTESPIQYQKIDDWNDYPSYPSRPKDRSLSNSPLPAKMRKRVSPYNNKSDNDSESESDSPYEDSPQISSNSLQPQQNSSPKKCVISTFWIIILVIIIILFYTIPMGNPEPNRTTRKKLINTFERMEGQFTHQEEDFWRSIRLNIEEIRDRQKPSTIIFLYENSHKSESTMQRILNNVKGAAACYLTDCSKDPIEIQGSALNSVEIIADYGKVISRYRDPLGTSGVMIVEHLEEVPGKVAQAFHHFCDEYDPLVSNALLLFTVNVDKLPNDEESDSYLRKTLALLWNDIGRDDKFEPLYARISGTILLVRAE